MDSSQLIMERQTTTKKVLLIDDEPIVRESMAVYLEDSGYVTLEAQDGTQGLELFYEFMPDVVVCDLRMPKLDGLEVLKKLTEISPDTPIIIVSGAGQINDVVEALRLGALDYLVKPVTDMAVLENAIQNALRRHELEIQNKAFKEELAVANEELEKHLILLQADQEAGRRAQIQLLPEPNAQIGDYLFEHATLPAENLSGDFLDYFLIDEDRIGFYIADVSGHGASAAFITMTLKSLINQPLREYRQGKSNTIISPSELVNQLNRELLSANLKHHISLFYGVIDSHAKQLNYCLAGHYPAPVIFNKRQYQLISDAGVPLGMFDWAQFESQSITIGNDFRVIMVSGGWLEIVPEKSQLSGEDYLLAHLRQDGNNIDGILAPLRALDDNQLSSDVTVFTVTKNR